MQKIRNLASKLAISRYADVGPISGQYSAGSQGFAGIQALIAKEHFALDIPSLSDEEKKGLPDIEQILPLFRRKGEAPKGRVSLLLPFFAQHLTDAIFQSDNNFETGAPSEIILNQIYSNSRAGMMCLRSGEKGKLKSREINLNGKCMGEFPPALFEKVGASYQVKNEFKDLPYLAPEKTIRGKTKLEVLLETYRGREEQVMAIGLFQGNMTLGNFALTVLLLREHNRLCDEIYDEFKQAGKPTNDKIIFDIASSVNILTYMKIVIEDYINAYAGIDAFRLDYKSFFYEKKRWCRATPIPYHFNTLYQLHCFIPNQFDALPDMGFDAFLANNDKVIEFGLGKVFEFASQQPASKVELGNSFFENKFEMATRAMLTKARDILAPFSQYRTLGGLSNDKKFELFDPRFREQIRDIYGNKFENVDYTVGIYAELPSSSGLASALERMGFKKEHLVGNTLLRSIAKHAFRHIHSNPLMRKELLNADVLSNVGWYTFTNTKTARDLIIRNIPETNKDDANKLEISFHAPDFR